MDIDYVAANPRRRRDAFELLQEFDRPAGDPPKLLPILPVGRPRLPGEGRERMRAIVTTTTTALMTPAGCSELG